MQISSSSASPTSQHLYFTSRCTWIFQPRPFFVVIGCLLTLHFLLGLTSLLQQSPSFDEPAHLGSGYIAARYGDFRFNPEGGQMAQRWAALPLLLLPIDNPALYPDQWLESTDFNDDAYTLGNELLVSSGHTPGSLLIAPRMMILLLSVVLGLVICLWTRSLFGPIGALISTTLFAFSPTLLAHGSRLTADLAVTLFFILSILAIWRTIHKINWLHLLLTGLALGGLMLSKYSGILIAPTTALLILIKLAWGRPLIWDLTHRRVIRSRYHQIGPIVLAATVSLGIAWALIWLAYGLRFDASFSAETFSLADAMTPVHGYFLIDVLHRWQLLPQSFLFGLEYTLHNAQGRPAFMHGHYSFNGWRTFFPYAFFIKTPLPVLLSMLLATAVLLLSPSRRRHVYRLAPLIIFGCFFAIVAVRSQINIGHRHILPLYPVLFIMIGVLATGNIRLLPAGAYVTFLVCKRIPMLVISLLLMWQAITALSIWPHYLAYFNPLIGGPTQGYRHLVDSSLDWGQELQGYDAWVANHPVNQAHFLAYFGSIAPPYYSDAVATRVYNLTPYAEEERVPMTILQSGQYAVSATWVQGVLVLGSNIYGPWSDRYESEYQAMLTHFEQNPIPLHDEHAIELLAKQTGNDLIWKQIRRFEYLRFARLCAYLRTQLPDHMIGYSILIYDLDHQDLYQAILASPPAFLNR